MWTWSPYPFGDGDTPNPNPRRAGLFIYDLRFPGQIAGAWGGKFQNGHRDYDPTVGRYVESDPIGLQGGSYSTYAYVGDNPISNEDPTGMMCMAGVGCWTTPAEARLAWEGDYNDYYQLACADGDAYACFAQHIEKNDNWWGHRATDRLLDKLHKEAENTNQCLDTEGIMDQIKTDLAEDYATYLPSSPDQATWLSAEDIAQIHWNVFGQFGLPPSTFGGTPFGQYGPLFLPGVWCPECTL